MQLDFELGCRFVPVAIRGLKAGVIALGAYLFLKWPTSEGHPPMASSPARLIISGAMPPASRASCRISPASVTMVRVRVAAHRVAEVHRLGRRPANREVLIDETVGRELLIGRVLASGKVEQGGDTRVAARPARYREDESAACIDAPNGELMHGRQVAGTAPGRPSGDRGLDMSTYKRRAGGAEPGVGASGCAHPRTLPAAVAPCCPLTRLRRGGG